MKERGDRPGNFDSSEIIITREKSTVIFETRRDELVQNPQAVATYLIEELGATNVNIVRSCEQDSEETSSQRFTIEWDNSRVIPRLSSLPDIYDPN